MGPRLGLALPAGFGVSSQGGANVRDQETQKPRQRAFVELGIGLVRSSYPGGLRGLDRKLEHGDSP